MKRLAIATSLLGLFLALAGGTWGQSPLTDRDQITVFDRVKKAPNLKVGDIQAESPTDVSVKAGLSGKLQIIPAADIIDIVYKAPDKKAVKGYKDAMTAEQKATNAKVSATEKKRLLEEAVKGYQDILPSFKSNAFGYRHMQYKIARLTALLARDDKAQTKSAVTLLAKFRQDHPKSWQITSLMEKLADLQRDSGDYKAAAKTYDEMSQMDQFNLDKRKLYEQEAAMALLKGKDHKTAKDRLSRIRATLKADDPQNFRLQMYIAQCDAATPGQMDKAIGQLRKVILDTKEDDKFRKSVAHATLADCYLARGDGDSLLKALLEYLKVDVLYGSDKGGDKQEHARVCTELSRLFRNRAISQPSRAKEYEEKAEMLRR